MISDIRIIKSTPAYILVFTQFHRPSKSPIDASPLHAVTTCMIRPLAPLTLWHGKPRVAVDSMGKTFGDTFGRIVGDHPLAIALVEHCSVLSRARGHSSISCGMQNTSRVSCEFEKTNFVWAKTHTQLNNLARSKQTLYPSADLRCCRPLLHD